VTEKESILYALEEHKRFAGPSAEEQMRAEVQFLFPKLTEQEQALVWLLGLRRLASVWSGLKKAPDFLTRLRPEDRMVFESGVINPSEALFTESRIQAEKLVVPKLNAVQKEILQERFLDIPFDN
jgi:hypothetical protein